MSMGKKLTRSVVMMSSGNWDPRGWTGFEISVPKSYAVPSSKAGYLSRRKVGSTDCVCGASRGSSWVSERFRGATSGEDGIVGVDVLTVEMCLSTALRICSMDCITFVTGSSLVIIFRHRKAVLM